MTSCKVCSSFNFTLNEPIAKNVMLCHPFKDNENKQHLHDTNIKKKEYLCKDCSYAWVVIIPHECWCGWIQDSYRNIGYQGPRMKIHKKPMYENDESETEYEDLTCLSYKTCSLT